MTQDGRSSTSDEGPGVVHERHRRTDLMRVGDATVLRPQSLRGFTNNCCDHNAKRRSSALASCFLDFLSDAKSMNLNWKMLRCARFEH